MGGGLGLIRNGMLPAHCSNSMPGVDIEACVTCRGWIVTLPGASPAATPPSGTGSTETGSQTTSQPVPNSGDMVEQCKHIIARGLADNVTMSRLTTLFEYCGTSLSL